MKVPLSWLREYVDIAIPVGELARRLTLAGLELGGFRALGLPIPEGVRVAPEDVGPVWEKDKVITAQVVSVEKHPNADKLKLVHVEYGAAQPKVVVTGAPNLNVGDVGQKVILGLAGTQYWDGHASPKKLASLKPTQLRGVPSDAMVMSEFELGLSDEHEGIIILPDDAPIGKPLADLRGDYILELDILPNMARCLSLLGAAREVSALTGQAIRKPPTDFSAKGPPIAGKVAVAIADPNLAGRYAAMLIEGVKLAPAPGWMQRRLANAGMRPINNVVDITNYVMLEWGQPLHAFDYDVLVERAQGQAPSIVVRAAREGEILVTLDNVERKLTAETLVIADVAGPIALAGVMGGRDTEVTQSTTNILLESANFDLVSIRRTMKALNLPSEASLRFSKGIHPEIVAPAAQRAARLLAEFAGGVVCQGMADTYPGKPKPQIIELPMIEIQRILGIDVPKQEVARILDALEFHVESAGENSLRVTSPPNRLDIQAGAADLIEEVARIYGYDRVPATLLADPLPPQAGNADLEREESVRDRLVDLGLQEVITYSLTTPEREAPLQASDVASGSNSSRNLDRSSLAYVTILNPISTERVAMRHTVLAGVLEVVALNLKHSGNVRVFEVGSVYLPHDGEKLPSEPRRLAIAMTGQRALPSWQDGTSPAGELDFYDLKGVIESLMGGLHISGVGLSRRVVAHLHPGRSAELLVNAKSVGCFGELHPNVAKAFDLGSRAILVAELDLEPILAAIPSRYPYQPVPRFPAALRDIAVVVSEEMTAERVLAEIRIAGGNLLCDVRLFDVYRGPSIPSGTKSLAYALTYQADDRTLTDKEVDKAHKKIEDRLAHVLKGQIRGKD